MSLFETPVKCLFSEVAVQAVMSCWPECSGAAESRKREVTSILRETKQKNIRDTLYQSMRAI
ncbi:hypothetical protein G3813_005189 [Escherichia coli]|nr:hypothetical protein [Escherichia coli]